MLRASSIIGKATDTFPSVVLRLDAEKGDSPLCSQFGFRNKSPGVNKGKPNLRESELLELQSCTHLKALANHMRRQS